MTDAFTIANLRAEIEELKQKLVDKEEELARNSAMLPVWRQRFYDSHADVLRLTDLLRKEKER